MYQFELNPWISPRGSWEKEVEKVLDDFHKTQTFSPCVEVVENDEAFIIALDVPGVLREDIEIEVKDKTLSVTGERKQTALSEKVVRTENKYGKFSRFFSLPQNVKVEGIEASCQNGVLEITLPKGPKAQVKKISISDWKKSDVVDLKN